MEFDKKVLNSTYTNPNNAGSFGGVNQLYRVLKEKYPDLTLNQVVKWLNTQESYTLFKKTIRKFPRLKTLTQRVDEQWQADLMDVSWFSKYNNNVKYLLVVIDIFSRFAWALPLKDKSAQSVTNAMKLILENDKPEKLQTDQGKEFVNSTFKSLMKENNINFFTTTDDAVKCAIVERFNRTLRERIYRYMHFNSTTNYIDALQDIVNGYNQNYHRSIKEAPINVNADNEARISLNQKERHLPNVYDRLKDAKYVRIAKKKNIFEKGSTKNWTTEIFKIIKRKKTPQTFIYKLEDLNGEQLTSIFYPDELQKAMKKRGRPIVKKKRGRPKKTI